MTAPDSVGCQVAGDQPQQSDNQPGKQVARLAAGQKGILSTAELRACGLSDGSIGNRVRNGTLHRRYRGVYHVGHANPSVDACFLAATKAIGDGSRLSHFAAGAAWELLEWDFRVVELTIQDTTPRTRRGLKVHRTRRLDPRDVTILRGIPVTTPARTIVDLAGQASERQLKQAIRRAQAFHGVTIPDILAALDRAGRRRGRERRGCRGW